MQAVDFDLHAGKHLEQYLEKDVSRDDTVNKPPHYNQGNIECITYIEQVLGAGFPSYCKGNVTKYLHRSAYKGNEVQDLKKARWYLDRMITWLEEDS
jgi:hypothetical protein